MLGRDLLQGLQDLLGDTQVQQEHTGQMPLRVQVPGSESSLDTLKTELPVGRWVT